MKKTGLLRVEVSGTLGRERVVMHPNDGFDLGLLQAEHSVRLCLNLSLEGYLKGAQDEGDPVSLSLRNDCPGETLIVGVGLFRLLGKPAKAVVLYDGDRLFVQGRLV